MIKQFLFIGVKQIRGVSRRIGVGEGKMLKSVEFYKIGWGGGKVLRKIKFAVGT
jgi:hypothetical protein